MFDVARVVPWHVSQATGWHQSHVNARNPEATRGMLNKLAHANGNRECHGCATWAHGDRSEKGLGNQ